jgi:hypothetical protein
MHILKFLTYPFILLILSSKGQTREEKCGFQKLRWEEEALGKGRC